MSNKLLSILMPVYNDEKYITETMGSIFNAISDKANENLTEVILVDDGSTDSTTKILKNLQQKYRFDFIVQKNKGAMATLNQLLRMSSGKYVYMIDHDDLLAQGALDRILSYLRQHPDVDMLTFDYESFWSDTADRRFRKAGWDFKPDDGQSVYVSLVRKNMWYSPLWMRVIRRKCIIENGLYFNEKLKWGDFEYMPRLISFVRKVGYLQGVVYYWREHKSSLSHKVGQAKQYGLLIIQGIDELLKFLNAKHLSKAFVQATYMFCCDNYWAAYYDVMSPNGYNDELIEKLEQHKYLMKYSRKWNRKYIYRPLVYLLGVKRFCKLRYGK